MTTGQMNRRPIFQNIGFSQDIGGGATETVIEQWKAWAQIIDTNAAAYYAQAQMLPVSNFKVTVRFDGRFKSTTRMIYEGQLCICQTMDIQEEGNKRFLVMRYTKTDTWVDLS